jgi:hypothetical protein
MKPINITWDKSKIAEFTKEHRQEEELSGEHYLNQNKLDQFDLED